MELTPATVTLQYPAVYHLPGRGFRWLPCELKRRWWDFAFGFPKDQGGVVRLYIDLWIRRLQSWSPPYILQTHSSLFHWLVHMDTGYRD